MKTWPGDFGLGNYTAGPYRLKDVLLLRRDGASATPEAEHRVRRSVDSARKLRAESGELRAATSLARLRRDQGERQQARDSLARLRSVYRWVRYGRSSGHQGPSRRVIDYE